MREFTIQLKNVPGSYYDFVLAILTYVKKNQARFETVKKYMDDNPSATTSDIIEFVSGQPDFFEDAAYANA